jgi:hypothetical protein
VVLALIVRDHPLARLALECKEPVPTSTKAFYFGLYNPCHDGEQTANLYLAGADQFDEEDETLEWACDPAYFPAGRYSHSEILRDVYAIAYNIIVFTGGSNTISWDRLLPAAALGAVPLDVILAALIAFPLEIARREISGDKKREEIQRVAAARNHFNKSEGHDAPIRAMAFSPDGMILASGSDDLTIYSLGCDDGDRTSSDPVAHELCLGRRFFAGRKDAGFRGRRQDDTRLGRGHGKGIDRVRGPRGEPRRLLARRAASLLGSWGLVDPGLGCGSFDACEEMNRARLRFVHGG